MYFVLDTLTHSCIYYISQSTLLHWFLLVDRTSYCDHYSYKPLADFSLVYQSFKVIILRIDQWDKNNIIVVFVEWDKYWFD